MTLTFTDNGHVYQKDGVVIPSVTQVLTMAGIDDVSMIPIRNLEHARDVGSAVHVACSYLDLDDLDIDSLDPAIVGYVVGYQRFRQAHNFVPNLIEERMSGTWDGLAFGMCLDRAGTMDDRCLILDIKTSSKAQPSWGIQTAAYADGYNRAMERAVVHLAKDGTFKLLWHTLESDFDVWHAALRIAHWKLKNGRKLPH